MKRLPVLFIGLFLFFPKAWALPGVVVEKTGSLLLITPDGKKRLASTGTEFYDGCRLVNAKGDALLLLMNGALVSLSGDQSYETGKLKNPPLKKTVGGLAVALEESLNVRKMGPVGVNTSLEIRPPEGGVRGIFPVYGNIDFAQSLSFQWSGRKILGSGPSLIVTKKGVEPARIFPLKRSRQEVVFSAEQLGLVRGGDYAWYLGHLQDKQPIGQSRVFTFHVLTAEVSQRLQKDLAAIKVLPLKTGEGREFLKAQIFYRYQMYHDMIDILKTLWKKIPERGVNRFLYLGYVRLGRHDEAQKYAD